MALRPEQIRRTIAIVVDDLALSFQQLRASARRFKDMARPPDATW